MVSPLVVQPITRLLLPVIQIVLLKLLPKATSRPFTVQPVVASHRHGIDAGTPAYCRPTSLPLGLVSPVNCVCVEKSMVVSASLRYSIISRRMITRSVYQNGH